MKNHNKHANLPSALICNKCHKKCLLENYIQIKHSNQIMIYHMHCFLCHYCNQEITSSLEDKLSKCIIYENYPYHNDCIELKEIKQAIKEGKMCKICLKPCYQGNIVTISNNELYHSTCLKCNKCKELMDSNQKIVKYGNDNLLYHQHCINEIEKNKAIKDDKICKICNKPCYIGSIIHINEHDLYHQECFLCAKCDKKIDSQYYQNNDLFYHITCTNNKLNQINNKTKNNIIDHHNIKRYCKKCSKICDIGRFYITNEEDIYHVDCFNCNKCSISLTNKYLTDPNNTFIHYCLTCYQELYSPICCICTDYITGRYLKHSYFDNEIYCISHHNNKSCFACQRKEPKYNNFIDLKDNRYICQECAKTMVVDCKEAEIIYKEIIEYMKKELGLLIPKDMYDVPILLLDVVSLHNNRVKFSMNQSTLGYHHQIQKDSPFNNNHNADDNDNNNSSNNNTNSNNSNSNYNNSSSSNDNDIVLNNYIRGVTLCSCTEEVKYNTITKQNHYTNNDSNITLNNLYSIQSYSKIYQTKQVIREVTAVLVLYGLPKVLLTSIIAHEAMHVWLKLNKHFPFYMIPKLEEGLCQAISYMYLESLLDNNNNDDNKLNLNAESKDNNSGISSYKTTKCDNKYNIKEIKDPLNYLDSNDSKYINRNILTNSDKKITKNIKNNDQQFKNIIKKKKKNLINYFLYQIKTDKSEIYGIGFKEVWRSIKLLGFNKVLKHIETYQKLP